MEKEEMKDNIYEFMSSLLKVLFFIIGIAVFCIILYEYGKSQKEIIVKPEIKCIVGTTWELDAEKTFYVLQPDSKKCLTVYEEVEQRVVK
jgi:hypothetical protein